MPALRGRARPIPRPIPRPAGAEVPAPAIDPIEAPGTGSSSTLPPRRLSARPSQGSRARRIRFARAERQLAAALVLALGLGAAALLPGGEIGAEDALPAGAALLSGTALLLLGALLRGRPSRRA